jgi:hypothetical protein
MTTAAQKKAVQASRRRAAKKGLVRVEVMVPKRSAKLIRAVAADLRAKSAKDADMAAPEPKRPKGWVSAAEAFACDLPDEYFEGVFEEGPRKDTGRDIDL